MSTTESFANKRLYLWSDSSDLRRNAEARLPKSRWSLTAVSQKAQDLASAVTAAKPDGIVFASGNIPFITETLRLLEQAQPECCRFVVCSRKNEGAFHGWKGIPPTVLKEDDSAAVWTDKVERALLIHRWLMNPEFRAILPHIREIPSLPESHRRIVEALRDPDFHIDTVAKLINQDVALTTQILKTVNSAALGLSQPVQGIPAAISVIGVIRVQSLVMSAWAFFFSNEKACKGFSPTQEWNHALAVAEAAQQLARDRRAPAAIAEEAFTAGILHDVGKVLQAANSPDAYSVVIKDARKQGKTVWEMEKEYFGYTHAELGGCMLGLWGLALPVVQAVALHHTPEPGIEHQATPRALVFLANRNVHTAPPPQAPKPAK